MATLPVTLQDVRAAAERLAGVAHITPVLTSSYANKLSERELFFKTEIFQRERGHTEQVGLELPAPVHLRSGNHAQAISLSAKLCGKAAHIVMPKTAPACKLAAVRDYGGVITLCEPTQASREGTADSLLQTLPGAVMIPPFDHVDVIAGQGTVAIEILEQVPSLDAIIAPIGGGGLISGICVAAKSINPNIKVFGAEPALASDAYQSFKSGTRTPLPGPTNTIADGLRTQLIGEKTFAIMTELLDDIFLVSEDEIIAAMRLLWERMKLVVEPSGAVPLAAALSAAFRAGVDPSVHRVCIVLSGGNQDLDTIPWK